MKAKAMQAEKVVLALPLIKGDTVAVPYFGHILPLKVVDVEPEGTVIVT
jgi:hypothetical protein